MADRADFKIGKIVYLSDKFSQPLREGRDKEAYESLEAVRKMAEEENHWFEEFNILLNEVWYLIQHGGDDGRQLFYAANLRMKELQRVFDMPDDEFKSKFEEIYLHGKIQILQERTFEVLIQFYDQWYIMSDFMAAHMNYSASLLCNKAMGKIEMLSGHISVEDRIERLFKMTGDYSEMHEFDQAMRYFNEAIKTAREEDDMTYEYIGLLRKLSICLISEHAAAHCVLDAETMSAVGQLHEMCDGNCPDPVSLGKSLEKMELDKTKNASKAAKKKVQWRISRLREAMPVTGLLLAANRGNWTAASPYAQELKKAEMEAYGANSDLSNSDMIMPMYAMLCNSEYRKEAAEEDADADYEEEEEDMDTPYQIEFPEDTLSYAKYRFLITESRNEMQKKHPLAAIALAEQAEGVASEVYSDYHRAMAIHTIGKEHQSAGHDKEALLCYQEAVKILAEPAHPGTDVSISQSMLYATLFEIGFLTRKTNPEESIGRLTDAIGMLSGKKNDEMYYLTRSLQTRAVAKANAGDVEGKEEDFMHALHLTVDEAKRRMPFMTKESRENYWAEVSEFLQQIVSLADSDSSPAFRRTVYDAVLMAKGFLLSSEMAERNAIYHEESLRDFIPLYQELEEYEAARLPWGTQTEDSAEEYMAHYMKTMRLLMAVSGVVEKYYDFMHIGFDTVARTLDEDVVVTDFYDYPTDDGDRQYVAFVYGKDAEAPELVKVCKDSELQQVYDEVAGNRYSDGSPFHISEAYNPSRKYSARLYRLILHGILSKRKLSADSSIYFVPSGLLHKIPVESLAVEDGTTATVSDLYPNFARISHARTLTHPAGSDLESIGLFGGLDYGGGHSETSHARGYRTVWDDRTPTPLAPWNELPQTQQEVNNISFLWQMAKGTDAVICTGKDGTPEKFKKLSEAGCSVVHLATHGFFETRKSKVNIPGLKEAYRPMDLTGIVMSNGNEGWLHGDNKHHEGIMTATDIAKMDLSKTQLVVLSACYTGEGIVRADGVFGLQRAFKKAGAGTIVMSLWNEEDKVGSHFMSLFYSYLLSGDMDRRQAFRLAQDEIRRKCPHPLLWANFIMID